MPTATLITITVMHRAGGGQWRKVGVAGNYAEALRFVNGPGDFWLRAGPEEPDDAAPSLLDDLEAQTRRPHTSRTSSSSQPAQR